MDMPTALKEVANLGSMFENDLDEEIDGTGGKFGFTVEEDRLVATFEPCVESGAGADGSDYGPKQEFVWHLVPVSGHAG